MNKIVFLTLTTLLFLSTAAAAADIFVTGKCRKDVEPDRVSVVLGSRTTEKDAATASKKVTATYEAIRKEVRKLNLKDLRLQTANYSVTPEWDYSTQKRVFKGYTAAMGLEVETSEIPRVGELFALTSKLGLQDVSGLTTFLSPALVKTEHENCLGVAVKEARVKAEKMSAAANLKLGDLITLSEMAPDAPMPMMGRSSKMMMAESASDSGAGMEVKPISVEIVIYAKYALK